MLSHSCFTFLLAYHKWNLLWSVISFKTFILFLSSDIGINLVEVERQQKWPVVQLGSVLHTIVCVKVAPWSGAGKSLHSHMGWPCYSSMCLSSPPSLPIYTLGNSWCINYIIYAALCQAAMPAHSPPPISTWPASVLVFLVLLMHCVSRTRRELREGSWGHLTAVFRSYVQRCPRVQRGREGGEIPGGPQPCLSPAQEHIGTVFIIWGRKKNKSVLLHAAKLPLKDLTLSWLPQLSHGCFSSQGASWIFCGCSAWGHHPGLIPTLWMWAFKKKDSKSGWSMV